MPRLPRSPVNIEIRSDQRGFICGKTGSGKTFFAQRLLRSLSRLVVLDSKGSLSGWGLAEWDRDARAQLISGEPIRIRAALPAGEDPEQFWESVLKDAYEAGNCFIYADEAGQVVGNRSRPTEWVTTVWTRGREYGVGAIAATQRPAWIPKIFLTEADHFFVFRLQSAGDRDYMADYIGDQIKDPIPAEDKYGFWYYDTARDQPDYIPRLPSRAAGGDGDEIDLELEEGVAA